MHVREREGQGGEGGKGEGEVWKNLRRGRGVIHGSSVCERLQNIHEEVLF